MAEILYFDDCDLVGCQMIGNTIVIDGIKYSVTKGDKKGI